VSKARLAERAPAYSVGLAIEHPLHVLALDMTIDLHQHLVVGEGHEPDELTETVGADPQLAELGHIAFLERLEQRLGLDYPAAVLTAPVWTQHYSLFLIQLSPPLPVFDWHAKRFERMVIQLFVAIWALAAREKDVFLNPRLTFSPQFHVAG